MLPDGQPSADPPLSPLVHCRSPDMESPGLRGSMESSPGSLAGPGAASSDLSWFFHDQIPEAARPLIAALLHPDPAQRPSATEAGEYTWCRGQSGDNEAGSPPERHRGDSMCGFETKDGHDNDDNWHSVCEDHKNRDSLADSEIDTGRDLLISQDMDESNRNCSYSVDGDEEDFVERLRSRTMSYETCSGNVDRGGKSSGMQA